MTKKVQKFQKYDHVQISEDLGKEMSNFTSGVEAIVIGSYADKFGGGDIESYILYLKGRGEVSWYYEHQLTLIEQHKPDILKLWEREKQKKDERLADLGWIFDNGEEILTKGYGPSVSSLARGLGINDLWGNRGEGIVYYENSMKVLYIAQPYLVSGDKEGWLDFCKGFQLR